MTANNHQMVGEECLHYPGREASTVIEIDAGGEEGLGTRLGLNNADGRRRMSLLSRRKASILTEQIMKLSQKP